MPDTNSKYDKFGQLNDFDDDSNIIEGGIGFIRWKSDNLQLTAIMEAVEQALKHTSPYEIVRRIEG